jgi:hypothetical protein
MNIIGRDTNFSNLRFRDAADEDSFVAAFSAARENLVKFGQASVLSPGFLKDKFDLASDASKAKKLILDHQSLFPNNPPAFQVFISGDKIAIQMPGQNIHLCDQDMAKELLGSYIPYTGRIISETFPEFNPCVFQVVLNARNAKSSRPHVDNLREIQMPTKYPEICKALGIAKPSTRETGSMTCAFSLAGPGTEIFPTSQEMFTWGRSHINETEQWLLPKEMSDCMRERYPGSHAKTGDVAFFASGGGWKKKEIVPLIHASAIGPEERVVVIGFSPAY